MDILEISIVRVRYSSLATTLLLISTLAVFVFHRISSSSKLVIFIGIDSTLTNIMIVCVLYYHRPEDEL